MRRSLIWSLGWGLSVGVCLAQASSRTQILVVGTFHMANPGHDLADISSDDVLLPKRQKEIAELVAVLAKFAPTKIAIEAEYGSERVTQNYSDYLAGKYTLSRNETNQVGFRLARELGLRKVYPVDVMEDFPWPHVINWAKANGMGDKTDALMAEGLVNTKAQSSFLASHTLLETVAFINSQKAVAADIGWYYRAAHLGDPNDDAGSELLTQWFKRNIEIYNNVHRLIESPNERILVLYGAGHLGWLRQDIANDPTVELRTIDEFVPKS